MKNLFFSLLAVAAVSASFVSCQDEVDLDLGPSHKEQPAVSFAGTYNGTWTQYDSDGKTVKSTSQGSVTIEAGETANVAVVSLGNDTDTNINGLTSVANVSWHGNGIEIFNVLATNGFSSPFMGEITESKAVNLKFSKTVRSGRTTVTVFYQFLSE